MPPKTPIRDWINHLKTLDEDSYIEAELNWIGQHMDQEEEEEDLPPLNWEDFEDA